MQESAASKAAAFICSRPAPAAMLAACLCCAACTKWTSPDMEVTSLISISKQSSSVQSIVHTMQSGCIRIVLIWLTHVYI